MPKSTSRHPKANKLDEAQKRWIVQRLACFGSLVVIAREFEAEFGFPITVQAVQAYDPTKHSGRTLSKALREYFEQTRARFLEHAQARIPEMAQAVRLQYLSEAIAEARAAGDFKLMASLLEQIAKECGGLYTNRRELTGADGKAIQVESMSDQELRSETATMLAMFGITLDEEKPRGRAKH